MSYFDECHVFVVRWEGGLDDHPSDPGGVTKYGVCIRFLKDFAEREPELLRGIGIEKPITRQTILDLYKAQAKEIFYHEFWLGNRLEDLALTHPNCAFVVYDTAVNMGSAYAKKLLQQAIGGLVVDGVWGRKTWAAIDTAKDKATALKMITLRKERYKYLAEKNQKLSVFLKGWLNRANDLEKLIG